MLERTTNLLRLCRTTALKMTPPFDYNRGTLFNSSFMYLQLIPSRTTKILRRVFPVKLYRAGNKPRLNRNYRIYDLVENSDLNPEAEMDIVLTSVVPGIGNPGDILTLPRTQAYHLYLLPGLAGYATPENLEYSKRLKKDSSFQEKLISPSVELCIRYLEKRHFSVVMNKETEWTVEPWHVRCSLRKAGVHVLSDSCVQMPPTPIKGPDLDLEGKEFYVTLMINKKHKAELRCAIHHWSTNIVDKLPYEEDFWQIEKGKGKIFTEDGSVEVKEDQPSP